MSRPKPLHPGTPDAISNRLMDELVVEAVAPVDGYATVPERPGLGIELDEGAVDGKFQRIEGDILTNL